MKEGQKVFCIDNESREGTVPGLERLRLYEVIKVHHKACDCGGDLIELDGIGIEGIHLRICDSMFISAIDVIQMALTLKNTRALTGADFE